MFSLLFFNENVKDFEPISRYGLKFDYAYRPLCPVCDSPLQVEALEMDKQLKTKPKLSCPKDIKHYDRIPTDLIGEEKHIASIVSELFQKPQTTIDKIFSVKQ